MAGSQKESSTVHPFKDPILAARLEAIKQLAGGLSERVAVMDRNFNVIYANDFAWSGKVQLNCPAIRRSVMKPSRTGTIPVASARRRSCTNRPRSSPWPVPPEEWHGLWDAPGVSSCLE